MFAGRDYDVAVLLFYTRHRYLGIDVPTFASRDPKNYEYGNNLYAYVHCNPVNDNDPLGLMPYNEWCRKCVSGGLQEKQLAELRSAASKVEGKAYHVGNLEIGCGYCADIIVEYVNAAMDEFVNRHEPQCWDYKKIVAQKWAYPDPMTYPGTVVVLQHQFVALRPNIDSIDISGNKNGDSPIFDGWNALSNFQLQCHFSEGTVSQYHWEWNRGW
jgi:RHS repeat-associated protein